MRFSLPMRAFALAVLLAAPSFLPACKGCGAGEGAGDAGSGAAAAPVPAPAGLVVEGTLAEPNLLWTSLQKGVGGVVSLLPRTLGGLVTALGSIDPALSPEIDGARPAYGVVATTAAGPSTVGYAAAVKLTDERRVRARLFEGNEARYSGKDVAGMTLLVPKGGGTLPVVAAVAPGGFLVLARSEGDLAALGPYAHRTLPSRPCRQALSTSRAPRSPVPARGSAPCGARSVTRRRSKRSARGKRTEAARPTSPILAPSSRRRTRSCATPSVSRAGSSAPR